MEWMQNLIDSFIGLLSNLLNSFIDWFYEIIVYIVEYIFIALNYFIEAVLSFLLSLFNMIGNICTGYGLNTSNAWSTVPGQVVHFLYMINIISIVQILICAIFVRMIFNLIPSWMSRI